MADFFVWDATKLSTKVAEMDKEHIELIRLMNKVHASVEAKKSFPEIKKELADLGNYTVKHFKDEEIFMEKIKYQGLSTHKIIHQKLLEQFGEYMAEFEKTRHLDEKFFRFLTVWLKSHIMGVDVKYGDAFQKAG
jgi:hemerythrin